MADNIFIRTAKSKDLLYLVDIYNYEIENGTSTLEISPQTPEQRHEWLVAHNVDNHPLIVAEVDGHVIGYACLSPYREKTGYHSTVELSVYVDILYRRKGIASLLVQKIIEIAKNDPSIHAIISVIIEGNDASVQLHRKFGFTLCGTIREAGYKFGKCLDISLYELLV
jgi:phosphinothricin acetyltransferase